MTAATDTPERLAEAPKRHAAFARAASALRPTRSGRFPLERVLLTGGAICIPVGVILILLGWWGSAHTSYLWEQNDYLISGGLLGLGLIFIGCAFYFGYWITRQIRAIEAGNQQTLRILTRLEAQQNAPAHNGSSPANVNSPGSKPLLLATQRGHLVHRPDCPVVANKDNLRSVDPDGPGLRPCQVCDPFQDQ